ncbi:MAG TPA: TM2 domain-containing protein [Planctomycetaceae bacterium]|nr:TM2 domain-containing protein [Planctomycetaceae bacterium]
MATTRTYPASAYGRAEHAIRSDTHSTAIGYLLWLFGFFGAHRFYFGRPVTGTIWFFTLGLLFVGWIVDLFLIPRMDREADIRYRPGPLSYNLTWILLTFLGVFGAHRLYMRKYVTAVIYFFTGGLLLLGVLYDYWTLNAQVDERNTYGSR